MKYCLLLFVLFPCTLFAQPYWQQELHYNINVSLNDKARSLSARLNLDYINHSPDTLGFIWFHLWPNAYKDNTTAFAQQLAALKGHRKTAKGEKPGYIDSLAFMVNGQPANIIPHPSYNDVVKLMLPQPLLPGKTVNISTPFHVQLPTYYSRSGYDGHEFMICQWYPKPAVYDRKGWHPMPYLDEGEFYSEYGSFTVNITAPSNYVVGATGQLQTGDELERYRTAGAANYRAHKTVAAYQPPAGPVKTLQFRAENVHDFAWFTSRDFAIQYDTLQLPNNKAVDVFAYYHPHTRTPWNNSVSFIKGAVSHYSSWVGEYPYPVVSAVEGPANRSSGGMEYPMITLITSPDASDESLDAVIAHEVGHNWFYGMLGSNERDHPWMDEGVNSYFEFRYEAEKYRGNMLFGKMLPREMKNLEVAEFQHRVYGGLSYLPFDKPIESASTDFDNTDDYGLVVYVKTAVWMYSLETGLGRDTVDKCIQHYFSDWKGKHPCPEDMKASFEKTVGHGLGSYFDLLNKTGRL